MVAGNEELEAEELLREAGDVGAVPIHTCGERERVCVSGTLRTVTLGPRGGSSALVAELYDGSDAVDLVWLGRRKIAGIEPGRLLRAEGLVTMHDGRKIIYNPWYDLRSASGSR